MNLDSHILAQKYLPCILKLSSLESPSDSVPLLTKEFCCLAPRNTSEGTFLFSGSPVLSALGLEVCLCREDLGLSGISREVVFLMLLLGLAHARQGKKPMPPLWLHVVQKATDALIIEPPPLPAGSPILISQAPGSLRVDKEPIVFLTTGGKGLVCIEGPDEFLQKACQRNIRLGLQNMPWSLDRLRPGPWNLLRKEARKADAMLAQARLLEQTNTILPLESTRDLVWVSLMPTCSPLNYFKAVQAFCPQAQMTYSCHGCLPREERVMEKLISRLNYHELPESRTVIIPHTQPWRGSRLSRAGLQPTGFMPLPPSPSNLGLFSSSRISESMLNESSLEFAFRYLNRLLDLAAEPGMMNPNGRDWN